MKTWRRQTTSRPMQTVVVNSLSWGVQTRMAENWQAFLYSFVWGRVWGFLGEKREKKIRKRAKEGGALNSTWPKNKGWANANESQILKTGAKKMGAQACQHGQWTWGQCGGRTQRTRTTWSGVCSHTLAHSNSSLFARPHTLTHTHTLAPLSLSLHSFTGERRRGDRKRERVMLFVFFCPSIATVSSFSSFFSRLEEPTHSWQLSQQIEIKGVERVSKQERKRLGPGMDGMGYTFFCSVHPNISLAEQ